MSACDREEEQPRRLSDEEVHFDERLLMSQTRLSAAAMCLEVMCAGVVCASLRQGRD